MKEENEQSNNEVTIHSASKAEVEESFRQQRSCARLQLKK
jgi:hypothetical protein